MAQTNKRGSINFKIDLEMYPFILHFSAGESDEILKRRLLKEKVDPEYINLVNYKPGTVGRAILFSGNIAVLRIIKFDRKDPYFYSILHHELMHIVHFIMDQIGMPLTDASDEAYCYLIGYLTKKIYEKIL